MSPDPLRIVVADDDQLLRTALTQVLSLQGVDVVGQAGDGTEAVAAIRGLRPDVALVDLEMPGLDGIEVARAVGDVPTRVVIVTRHARPAQLQRALAAGAVGFILKSTSSDRLMAILTDIHAGQRYIDAEIAALALTMRPCPLTPRELEILVLVHAGGRTTDIARSLHLAPGTVRNYISSAMTRLGVGTGREAAAMAHAEGWI
jgi:two-component system response regulator DesR